MKDPVFIIGIARTGSKIYMNILNDHSPINISSELHFLAPRWKRKDFSNAYKSIVKENDNIQNREKIIDLMYSDTLEGTFWEKPNKSRPEKAQNRITDICKKKLASVICPSEISLRNLLSAILQEHMLANKKEIPGAKFPVDISEVPTLKSWYPSCKLIHIIRDPRAIYCSMKLGDLRRGKKSRVTKLFTSIKRFVYLIIAYKQTVKIHVSFKNDDDYLLLRFEDVISGPEKKIERMCSFLKINYKETMLSPPVKNSSFFNNNKGTGFDEDTLTRWKSYINPRTDRLIQLILRKEMQGFNYE